MAKTQVYELPEGQKLGPDEEDGMRELIEGDEKNDPFRFDPAKGETWPLAELVYGKKRRLCT